MIFEADDPYVPMRCVHGTYVGIPGGVDHLCQFCEGAYEWDPTPYYTLHLEGLNALVSLGEWTDEHVEAGVFPFDVWEKIVALSKAGCWTFYVRRHEGRWR